MHFVSLQMYWLWWNSSIWIAGVNWFDFQVSLDKKQPLSRQLMNVSQTETPPKQVARCQIHFSVCSSIPEF